MALRVYAYDGESKSAKMLAAHLQTTVVGPRSTTSLAETDLIERDRSFVADLSNVVVGWGNHGITAETENVLNRSSAVKRAVNKLTAFMLFEIEGVRCPKYFTGANIARQMLERGNTLYARTDVCGSDGAGLIVVKPGDALPHAGLYTVGLTNVIDEYRLTVFKGKVVSTQKKVPVSSRDPSTINYGVRTTDGGWGFDVVSPLADDLASVGPAACAALGLDMGGVDIVLAKDIDGVVRAYVLEVNTAPTLTPYSCSKLATAIKEYYKSYTEDSLLSQTAEEDSTTFSLPADLADFSDAFNDN